MTSNPLFNVMTARAPAEPPSEPGAPATPPPGAPSPVGVITAQQSAITFAGAPAIATVVWKVSGAAIPSLADQILFPIVLALVIGMLIYWQSATPGTRPKDKVLGFVFALLNSFAIAAATLGIDATMDP